MPTHTCTDFQHNVYGATILKEDDHGEKMLVHYFGWASKWDEWIDKDSDRLEKRNVDGQWHLVYRGTRDG